MEHQAIENVSDFMNNRFATPEDYRIWCHVQELSFLKRHKEKLVEFEIYDAAAVARDVINAKKKAKQQKLIR